MSYQNELGLLSATLQKSHVNLHILPASDFASAILLDHIGQEAGTPTQMLLPAPPTPKPRERYHLTDAYGLGYVYLLLPDERAQVLLIGPYLPHPISAQQILELGERIGISPEALPRLSEYVSSIPVVDRESPLFLLLDSFCERIWHSPSFSIVDLNQPPILPTSPIHEPSHADHFDDILLGMKTMEQRYAFENELIRAVSLGQMHMESQLFPSISDINFERRIPDLVRNAKNYSIIMNTLLRKAAESGGVHPLYIDRVSSDFARRIEQITHLSDSSQLMIEMFRSYCLLVQQHSLRNYSKVVQTAILLIDSDLSANLTLHTIAEHQNVSPGYLSTVFKKETGQTVTAYIRDKRMRHARHLLSTTNLQIQTVALHCGIMDVHYFTKQFKKETGLTPCEFRQNLHGSGNYQVR